LALSVAKIVLQMTKQTKILADRESEKQVIIGLLNHGDAAFYEVDNLISSNDFYEPYHYILYEAAQPLLQVCP
jgi:replicative DNA helicase